MTYKNLIITNYTIRIKIIFTVLTMINPDQKILPLDFQYQNS